MRILKVVLLICVLTFVGAFGVAAQDSNRGETRNGPIRDGAPALVIQTPTPNPAARELDDWDIDWAWAMCPGGWVSDGNGVVCEDLHVDGD
jgi:hypothetical protein